MIQKKDKKAIEWCDGKVKCPCCGQPRDEATWGGERDGGGPIYDGYECAYCYARTGGVPRQQNDRE